MPSRLQRVVYRTVTAIAWLRLMIGRQAVGADRSIHRRRPLPPHGSLGLSARTGRFCSVRLENVTLAPALHPVPGTVV